MLLDPGHQRSDLSSNVGAIEGVSQSIGDAPQLIALLHDMNGEALLGQGQCRRHAGHTPTQHQG